jgi:hypothetical protein
VRRLFNAIRVFFLTLFSAAVAGEVQALLARRALARERRAPGPAAAEPPPARVAEPKKPPRPAAPARSEALTLLATLQREARLVDFVKEPLAEYTDAQIAAVAREVHRDCGRILERLFALGPVARQEEGTELEVPAGFDAGRYRLAGNVAGEPPFRGRLVHHGWEAARCDLPAWTGSPSAARIVAPAEVEL